MGRFNRDYQVNITLGSEVITINLPLRIAFECVKSTFGRVNSCTIKLFNLEKTKREQLDFEEQDRGYIPFSLAVGYDGKLQGIFKGSVWRANSGREGTDYVTTIESIDGGQDYFNSFTARTVNSNSIEETLKDMPNTATGAITQAGKTERPVVLVGNSAKLIEESLQPDETMFIDDERMHIISDKKYIGDSVQDVNASTGLIATPTRSKGFVSFPTMLNPSIKIGSRVNIKSTVSPKLDGLYRIDTISYNGDSHGKDWLQDCTGRKAGGMVIAK